MLYFSGALATFCTFAKYVFPSNPSLRWYSKRLPVRSLLPLRVTTLIAAPELRPYSAEKFDVLMLTSSMKSMPTLLIWLLLLPESMLKPPSTVSRLALLRLPFTDVAMLKPVMMLRASSLRSGEPGISDASCM